MEISEALGFLTHTDRVQESQEGAGPRTRGNQTNTKRSSCDWTVYGGHRPEVSLLFHFLQVTCANWKIAPALYSHPLDLIMWSVSFPLSIARSSKPPPLSPFTDIPMLSSISFLPKPTPRLRCLGPMRSLTYLTPTLVVSTCRSRKLGKRSSCLFSNSISTSK